MNNDKILAENQNFKTPAEIRKEYKLIISDARRLDEAANYLFESLIEDAVMGVFLEMHHLCKSGKLTALDGTPEEDSESSYRIVDLPNYDIFGISTAKKPQDCQCPNCDRLVSAARFAPHLEKCMGMGRISSRIARRRLAPKDGSSNASSSSTSSYIQANAGTDDEDDVDWSAEKRRKKTGQNSRNNGAKKNGKASF